MSDNMKIINFDRYCKTCKHDAVVFNPDVGVYDGTKWSGEITKEEYVPCCYCLEEAAREGTELPLHWESKDE